MTTPVPAASLARAFLDAHTAIRFTDQPVDDHALHALHELLKWAPTSMNTQPARFVFVRSAAAKAKLKPTLSPGNVDKTMDAPVTVIVAHDPAFYDTLPVQFPADPSAREMFASNPALADETARRNGTLQGAYLIIAARMLGLDAGPMSGFDKAACDAAFLADTGWKSNFLVNLGYAAPSGHHPRGPRLGFDEAARIV